MTPKSQWITRGLPQGVYKPLTRKCKLIHSQNKIQDQEKLTVVCHFQTSSSTGLIFWEIFQLLLKICHIWQKWPVTQLYICQTTYFPMSSLSLYIPRFLEPWQTSLDGFVQGRKARYYRPWGLWENIEELLSSSKKSWQDTKINSINVRLSREKQQ